MAHNGWDRNGIRMIGQGTGRDGKFGYSVSIEIEPPTANSPARAFVRLSINDGPPFELSAAHAEGMGHALLGRGAILASLIEEAKETEKAMKEMKDRPRIAPPGSPPGAPPDLTQ